MTKDERDLMTFGKKIKWRTLRKCKVAVSDAIHLVNYKAEKAYLSFGVSMGFIRHEKSNISSNSEWYVASNNIGEIDFGNIVFNVQVNVCSAEDSYIDRYIKGNTIIKDNSMVNKYTLYNAFPNEIYASVSGRVYRLPQDTTIRFEHYGVNNNESYCFYRNKFIKDMTIHKRMDIELSDVPNLKDMETCLFEDFISYYNKVVMPKFKFSNYLVKV